MTCASIGLPFQIVFFVKKYILTSFTNGILSRCLGMKWLIFEKERSSSI